MQVGPKEICLQVHEDRQNIKEKKKKKKGSKQTSRQVNTNVPERNDPR